MYHLNGDPPPWNGADPRAYFPPAQLLCAAVPTRGTDKAMAQTPLPRGLGIYVVRADGARIPQPLTYISPVVADRRGHGMCEGWYVEARPDAQFELRVTATRDHDRIFGKNIRMNEGVRFDVAVDGVSANTGYIMQRDLPLGSEVIVNGFTLETKYRYGHEHGHESYSAFKFKRWQTADEGADPAPRDAGSVSLRFWVGKMNFNHTAYISHRHENAPLEIVDEKGVAKRGNSLAVERTGMKYSGRVTRSHSVMDKKDRKMVGGVKIFFRERKWLISRRIVNSLGEAWKEEPVPEKKEEKTVDEVVSDGPVMIGKLRGGGVVPNGTDVYLGLKKRGFSEIQPGQTELRNGGTEHAGARDRDAVKCSKADPKEEASLNAEPKDVDGQKMEPKEELTPSGQLKGGRAVEIIDLTGDSD